MDKDLARSLKGLRVLITGGTTGIGRAAFLALAREGAQLFTIGREAEPLTETLQLAGLDEGAGMNADVACRNDVERVFAAADARLGEIDALISCAALGAQPLHEMADEDWRYVVETNLVGTLAYARGALDRMLPRQKGHLVLVSSISPDIKARGESVYSATKAGINAFAMTLRKEIGHKSIRVTVIEPGSVGTDMQEGSAEEQRTAIERGEMLFAEEVAEGILFALTRSPRCDVSLLRMEPIRQKTA
ncbi:SDR family oxidoreductase [Novosphingobium jiangmenense]|uniref:SDR family oxidoreductase n=1 Tax=Novosphingobium jiangmenense TaxID=2791981 RepID=A0ABS0HLM0_9SPHN|nr:SDR family oxidoreductase [Novosphingobium jiangmenense]MBF9153153.1 SDR family oxidoreductase [Novosphingobium jiangmenense]